MIDYTEMFNTARIKAGREPTTYTITIIHEGMVTGCGCPVIRASGKTFTVQHDSDVCKYKLDRKDRVGDGIRNACASVQGQLDTVAMMEPWTGLFPHEQEAA